MGVAEQPPFSLLSFQAEEESHRLRWSHTRTHFSVSSISVGTAFVFVSTLDNEH